MVEQLLSETTVRLIGATTGVLALSIAIYFQMISAKKCPPVYIGVFAVTGIILIILNLEALGASRTESTTLELLLYIFIGVAELLGAIKLRNIVDERETSPVEEFIKL